MRTTQETYAMLENQSLWRTATRCHDLLRDAKIPHALLGGVAVCLHGYQRNTADVDLLIRPDNSDAVRERLTAHGFVWDDAVKEFRQPDGVPVQFLMAGDRAGKGSVVRLPDPGDRDAVVRIEDLPVLKLSRLLDAKIACGQGSIRRTHKDFADVVELIAVHRLNSSFARHLHKESRATFRQLVRAARGES